MMTAETPVDGVLHNSSTKRCRWNRPRRARSKDVIELCCQTDAFRPRDQCMSKATSPSARFKRIYLCTIETLEQRFSRHISFFLFFRAFLPSLIPAYLADRPAYHAGHPSTQPSLSEHCSHYFMEFVPEFFCLLLKSIR